MQTARLIRAVRIALGINFLWFGTLKLVEGLSPAEALAAMTIAKLTFGFVSGTVAVKLLAIWEIAVGVGLATGWMLPVFLRLFMVHMACTFTPLFLFPELCFTHVPWGLTLVGQYIVKNTVFIASGALVCNDYRTRRNPV